MSSKNEPEFPYSVEQFDKNKHERSDFSCGNKRLDRYLKEQASQDLERKLAVTYVLVEENRPEVIGYYTLSHLSVNFNALPTNIREKLPSYPEIPATLIGRLAVDKGYQGKRLGEHLLLNALEKSYERTKEIGSHSVVVDANEDVKGFYLKYDFRSLPDQKDRLFLPMKKIEGILEIIKG